MPKKRPAPSPVKPSPGLRDVSAPRLSRRELLGMSEEEESKLKELLRPFIEREKAAKRQADWDDGDLPPAA